MGGRVQSRLFFAAFTQRLVDSKRLLKHDSAKTPRASAVAEHMGPTGRHKPPPLLYLKAAKPRMTCRNREGTKVSPGGCAKHLPRPSGRLIGLLQELKLKCCT